MPAVLLVTSNGSGLGHLSRMTALARALEDGDAEPVLASMSAALPLVLAATGLRGEYIPGPVRSWIDPRVWQRYAADRLVALAQEVDARCLVFDGVAPYPAILLARSRLPGVPFVWFRRGMWKAGTNRRALWTTPAFDLVVEPGDFCSAADVGPTVTAEALRVPPVGLQPSWPPVERHEARERLGLAQDRPAALVTMGMSAGGDLAGPGNAAIAALLKDPDWQVAVTELPLRDSNPWLADAAPVVELRGVFPLAPVLGAFDLAVSGAGYNAVHELLSAGTPSLLIAKRTATDDQEARAREAERRGWALTAGDDDPARVGSQVARLLDPEVRERLRAACAALPPTDGASVAAAAIGDLLRAFPGHRETARERLVREFRLRRAAQVARRRAPWHPSTGFVLTSDPSVEALLGDHPVEHVLAGASGDYRAAREDIARSVGPFRTS